MMMTREEKRLERKNKLERISPTFNMMVISKLKKINRFWNLLFNKTPALIISTLVIITIVMSTFLVDPMFDHLSNRCVYMEYLVSFLISLLIVASTVGVIVGFTNLLQYLFVQIPKELQLLKGNNND